MRAVRTTARGIAVAVSAAGLLAAIPFLSPWIGFLLTVAASKGLVVLGIVLLMRAGLVSFGQGLFFAAGAYTVGFVMRAWELREALVLLALGVAASAVLAALVGPLMARYRDIFFAMLSLAFTMVAYGLLLNAYWLTGGTDGIGIRESTVAGIRLSGEALRRAYYYLSLLAAATCAVLVRRYEVSPLGYVARAVRLNEVRIEYLGASVQQAVLATYVLAGALAGLGGVLGAFAVGHVTPELAYWTTSGEFVMVALLAGSESILAPFIGSVVFELLRNYASKYSPYTWQLVMGSVMLAIILFLPGGLWEARRRVAQRGYHGDHA